MSPCNRRLASSKSELVPLQDRCSRVLHLSWCEHAEVGFDGLELGVSMPDLRGYLSDNAEAKPSRSKSKYNYRLIHLCIFPM